MDTTSIELIIVIISSIANIILGFITFRNNFKSDTNKLFFVFTLFLVSYLGFNFLSAHQPVDESTLFFIRLVMGNALLINFSFLLLVTTFPDEKIKLGRNKLLLASVFTLIMLPLTQTDLIFRNVVSGTNQPLPGVLIPLFALHTALFIGGGVLSLIKKYRRAEGEIKQQIRFLLAGTVFMFLSIILSNMIFVILFNTTTFIGLLPIYTTIFAASIAYAIVRHGLFDIKILATEAISVILWIVLFSKIFTSSSVPAIIVDSLVFVTVLVFGILLIRSVINEVKQREKLQELTEKLRALDKQKDEFLSMAAHELRAPMTAIKGYVSMVLEGDTGDIPEKARGFLADTSNITDRLIRLVNNMLNVSRIEEGRLTYQEEEEHLAVPMRSVFSQFRPEAERKGLKYDLEIPNDLKDKVVVDPDRIQEVVGNFISNAIKYTDSGFVKVVMSQPNETTVRVEVTDSGPGISKEEQQNLFKKFYRVESNVGKTTGTGLGLYISKLLVEKFKGKIGIDSEVGKGSVFWFELPLSS